MHINRINKRFRFFALITTRAYFVISANLIFPITHIFSGDAIYATSGKTMPLSNSSLLRANGRNGSSSRHHQTRGSGMTSSSSASSNSNNNAERNREREQRERDLEEQMLQDSRPALLLQLQSGMCKLRKSNLIFTRLRPQCV